MSYSATGLRVPADAGDLWEGMNNTRNTLLRDLPASWTRVEARVTFTPTQDYQHAGIVIYGNDDDYVELTRVHNTWSGGHTVALVSETAGTAGAIPRVSTTASALVLRLDRDAAAGTITASFSTNGGTSWQQVGSVVRTISNARLALNATGSTGGTPIATFHDVTIQSTGP